jgi:hypothetical protein
MRGSIRDVFGHPITQGGLLQGQTVLTLEKEAAVLSLLFRGECNQSLIQFAAQYYTPSACARFCPACVVASKKSAANRYHTCPGIPGSLLLITINPHGLGLTHPELGPAKKSIDQPLLLRLSLAKQSLYIIACEARRVLFVAFHSRGVDDPAIPSAWKQFFSFGIGG